MFPSYPTSPPLQYTRVIKPGAARRLTPPPFRFQISPTVIFLPQVVALCREASICALEEDRSATQVRQAHLLEALGQMRPQITPSVLASYAAFQGGGR